MLINLNRLVSASQYFQFFLFRFICVHRLFIGDLSKCNDIKDVKEIESSNPFVPYLCFL